LRTRIAQTDQKEEEEEEEEEAQQTQNLNKRRRITRLSRRLRTRIAQTDQGSDKKVGLFLLVKYHGSILLLNPADRQRLGQNGNPKEKQKLELQQVRCHFDHRHDAIVSKQWCCSFRKQFNRNVKNTNPKTKNALLSGAWTAVRDAWNNLPPGPTPSKWEKVNVKAIVRGLETSP